MVDVREIAEVPAPLIAINVKPQRLSDNDCLIQRVPLKCSSEFRECNCELYTKAGDAVENKRTGVPLPILM